LFNESIYNKNKWTVESPAHGYQITAPIYIYSLKEVIDEDEKAERAPSVETVERFISKIFMYMKLSNEVCLLGLIFIERLIVNFIIFNLYFL
jgi:hypothetical protein